MRISPEDPEIYGNDEKGRHMGLKNRRRTLKFILHQTYADKILGGYLAFILVSALLIWIFEPTITTYRGALWYCYAVISTVGFGDMIVTTAIPKVISVLITIYSIVVIAIITGIFVNYYNQVIEMKNHNTLSAFMDKLERLPELSPEELQDLSNRVIAFRKKLKN